MGKRGRDDFDAARREMAAAEPIAPISDHFAESSIQYQGAAGCASVASLVKSWRAIRRQRRLQRSVVTRVRANSRYTPKRRR
jgi:hypothetical protein